MARHDREESLEEQLAWLDAIKEQEEAPVVAAKSAAVVDDAVISPYPKDPWSSVPTESDATSSPLFRAAVDSAYQPASASTTVIVPPAEDADAAEWMETSDTGSAFTVPPPGASGKQDNDGFLAPLKPLPRQEPGGTDAYIPPSEFTEPAVRTPYVEPDQEPSRGLFEQPHRPDEPVEPFKITPAMPLGPDAGPFEPAASETQRFAFGSADFADFAAKDSGRVTSGATDSSSGGTDSGPFTAGGAESDRFSFGSKDSGSFASGGATDSSSGGTDSGPFTSGGADSAPLPVVRTPARSPPVAPSPIGSPPAGRTPRGSPTAAPNTTETGPSSRPPSRSRPRSLLGRRRSGSTPNRLSPSGPPSPSASTGRSRRHRRIVPPQVRSARTSPALRTLPASPASPGPRPSAGSGTRLSGPAGTCLPLPTGPLRTEPTGPPPPTGPLSIGLPSIGPLSTGSIRSPPIGTPSRSRGRPPSHRRETRASPLESRTRHAVASRPLRRPLSAPRPGSSFRAFPGSRQTAWIPSRCSGAAATGPPAAGER